MQKVALDTNILIHGVQMRTSPGEDWKTERAAALLARLEAKDVIAIIPAPVLAEYLVKLEAREVSRSLKTIQMRFTVAPLDVAAAVMAARLHKSALGDKEQTSLLDGGNVSKRHLKADVLITAIAKMQGCSALFTAENKFPKVCRDSIDVVSLSDAYGDLPLFR